MHFQLTIECSAPSLGGDTISRNQELANILFAVAAELLDQGLAPGAKLPLRDRNGHSVGMAQLTEQPRVLASGAFVKAGGQARPLRQLSMARRLQRD
ncbi:hypothetical protein [Methylocystis sp. SC2]|uniref:hypothetical protein n=1 Tax=Methylocystis sp. (strain SC2) TaxID=187303 RepID=UPI00027AE87D|nr:hypothetical protein [Methylocystis sp. SC2]CCJ07343.1 Hypothetical protein BN69_1892 [Methylocystis sp. SC2]